MNILIKSSEEIDKIRIACRLSSEVLDFIEPYVKSGISTGELDSICKSYIINTQKAIPACLNYFGFPKSICTSVNDVVCHGIPNYNEIIKDGDIINIDISVIKDGFYGDVSKMFFVGEPSKLAKKLCYVTRNSLYRALKKVRCGIRLREIGRIIQNFVGKYNFSIVREYCGHGIGKSFHEDPQVLHYDSYDFGVFLRKGMIFTIEPMINAGKRNIRKMKDGWTVKTQDRSLSAQYEHTLLVTDDGCEVLTFRQEESRYISQILINT